MSEVRVEIDNRVRLCSAILAASSWPAQAQAEQTHAVHHQAKLTQAYVAGHADHPAVALVEAHFAAGGALTDLFAAALACAWPTFIRQDPLPQSLAATEWPEELSAFYTDTAIAAFLWADNEDVWNEAAAQLRQIVAASGLADFLGRLRRQPLARDVIIVPNLLYPALLPLPLALPHAVYLVLPPPKAWGESPPWSYADGADWVLAVGCRSLVPLLLPEVYAALPAAGQTLLAQAATVLFLESAMDEAAAQAYLVRTKKEHDLPDLPAAVERLRAFLAEPAGADLAHLMTF